jgi:hypothetical protein
MCPGEDIPQVKIVHVESAIKGHNEAEGEPVISRCAWTGEVAPIKP